MSSPVAVMPQKINGASALVARSVRRFFSGTVSSPDDDGNVSILRARTVGSCPDGSLDNQDKFSYNCTLSTDTESGYDLCVTAGGRLGVDSGSTT